MQGQCQEVSSVQVGTQGAPFCCLHHCHWCLCLLTRRLCPPTNHPPPFIPSLSFSHVVVTLFEGSLHFMPTDRRFYSNLSVDPSWDRNNPAHCLARNVMPWFCTQVNKRLEHTPFTNIPREAKEYSRLQDVARKQDKPMDQVVLEAVTVAGHTRFTEQCVLDKDDSSDRLMYVSQLAGFLVSRKSLRCYPTVPENNGAAESCSAAVPFARVVPMPFADKVLSLGKRFDERQKESPPFVKDTFMSYVVEKNQKVSLHQLFLALVLDAQGGQATGTKKIEFLRDGYTSTLFQQALPLKILCSSQERFVQAYKNFEKGGSRFKKAMELTQLCQAFRFPRERSPHFDLQVKEALRNAHERGEEDREYLEKVLQLCFRGLNNELVRLLLYLRHEYMVWCLEKWSPATAKPSKAVTYFWENVAEISDETLAFVLSGNAPNNEDVPGVLC